jgi:hypothetical protein
MQRNTLNTINVIKVCQKIVKLFLIFNLNREFCFKKIQFIINSLKNHLQIVKFIQFIKMRSGCNI